MTTLVFKCSGEVGFEGGLRISRRQGNRQYDLASQQPRYGRSPFPASPLLPLSLMLCQLETETRIEWITIHITTASSRGYAAVLSKGQAYLSVYSIGSSGQQCTQGSSNNGITGAFMEPLGRPLFLPSIVIYVGTISVEFAVFCLETRMITAITHAACAFSLFVILKFRFDALDLEKQTKHNRHSHYTTRHAWPCRCLGATLPITTGYWHVWALGKFLASKPRWTEREWAVSSVCDAMHAHSGTHARQHSLSGLEKTASKPPGLTVKKRYL